MEQLKEFKSVTKNKTTAPPQLHPLLLLIRVACTVPRGEWRHKYGGHQQNEHMLTVGIEAQLVKEWTRDLPPAGPRDTARVPWELARAPGVAICWGVLGGGVRRKKERERALIEMEGRLAGLSARPEPGPGSHWRLPLCGFEGFFKPQSACWKKSVLSSCPGPSWD